MPYKILESDKIISIYEQYLLNQQIHEEKLDHNYLKLRKFLLDRYELYKEQKYEKYELDLNLGLDFYEFLNNEKDFNRAYESNVDFWKYIAVFVIPDIIADRHGIENVEYFYKKNVRIYPYAIYWYIHLSWQGTKELTLEVLKNNTTDEILQLVERPTKIGINLDLYRTIMFKYNEIDKKERNIYVNGKKISKFRVILMENTSKLVVVRPEIYPGGIKGYVDMLFTKVK